MELSELRSAAVAGSPEAQVGLAWRLMRGEGVEKDPEQAAHWMARAAEAGGAEAQYQLGVWLGMLGREHEAAEWLERAAEQGHAGAQVCLGHAYRHGHGVVTDERMARDWYARAAAQGHAAAARALEPND